MLHQEVLAAWQVRLRGPPPSAATWARVISYLPSGSISVYRCCEPIHTVHLSGPPVVYTLV